MSNIQRGTVWWLSLKDLRHEFLITLNLVLGTLAIIAPLLILFGIKFGTIETMRNRLLNDPKNLEIRPQSTQSYDQKWFDGINQDKRVQFAIPLTRKLASSVTLYSMDKSKRVKADIIPTKDADPLVMQNGGVIPHGHQVVLSSEVAKKLHIKHGEMLQLSVSRYMHNKIQKVKLNLKVVAMLTPRAGFLKTIYIPLELADKIEHYKDGLAVADLGWKGGVASAYPLYDGLFITSQEPISSVDQIRLVSGTGFAHIKEIDSVSAEKIAGYAFDNKGFIYLIKPYINAVTQTNIDAVSMKLRGKKLTMTPWVEPIDVTLQIDQQILHQKLYIAPSSHKVDRKHLYASKRYDANVILTVHRNTREFTMPIAIDSLGFESENLFAQASLVGEMNLLRDRALLYDSSTRQLLITRRGYAGFRIYAKSLEDVEPLKKSFEEKGISVSTQAQRIHDVRELDGYLTLIFWLIATVGVVGGTATLGANLYASVDRKRKELSVLRLLGLSRMAIFRFPLYQGVLIAVFGVLAALLLFVLMANLINRLFGDYLSEGEAFCRLSTEHITTVLLFAIVIAIVSSTIAAIKATRSDPAEAMRDE